MTKTTTGLIIAVISIGLIGGIVYSSNKDSDQMGSGTMSMSDEEMSSMQAPQDSGSSGDDQEIQSGAVSMNIEDFNFQNENLKVKVGTKVTWTNRDDARHDITPDNESPDFMGSELLGEGESYSYTFNKAGTYSYNCSPHPYMKASVEVVE